MSEKEEQTFMCSFKFFLERNLKYMHRRMFLHRFIYVGEHNDRNATENLFTESIEHVKKSKIKTFEKLTGLLLIYPRHFIHVLDGDDQGLHKHMKFLFANEEFAQKSVKLLVIYHNINQRFFDEWTCKHATPPGVWSKHEKPVFVIKEEIIRCIKMLYSLLTNLRVPSPVKPLAFNIGEIDQERMLIDLPDEHILTNILGSEEVFDLKMVFNTVDNLDKELNYATSDVYPVRREFIPKDVFETKESRLPVFLPQERNAGDKKNSNLLTS